MDFVWSDLSQPSYWIAVLQIIWINILLSGDNAVVIALACRMLEPRQRLWGMILGAGVAVLLRVIFTGVVAQIMVLPFLKLIGGGLLLWIAVKLILPGEDVVDGRVSAADSLWRAVRVVAIADIVMSLDNVVAIAGAADTAALKIGATIGAAHMAEAVAYTKASLIVFGLTTSIPLIVAGSALLLALLGRFPILVWAGAALLGWIAGEIALEDAAVVGWLGADLVHSLEYVAAGLGAALVLLCGYLLARRPRPEPDI